MSNEKKLLNGGVYCHKSSNPFVLVFFPPDKYGMLYICRHYQRNMSAPAFVYDADNVCLFTEQELQEKYDLDQWELLDGRLRIEKIDKFSLVEYSRGQLEKMKITEEKI